MLENSSNKILFFIKSSLYSFINFSMSCFFWILISLSPCFESKSLRSVSISFSLTNWDFVDWINSLNSKDLSFCLKDSLSKPSISITKRWSFAESFAALSLKGPKSDCNLISSEFKEATPLIDSWWFLTASVNCFFDSINCSLTTWYFTAKTIDWAFLISSERDLYLLASRACFLRDRICDDSSFKTSSKRSRLVWAAFNLNSASWRLTWNPDIPAASSRILLLCSGFWLINSSIWPCLTREGDLAPVDTSAKSIWTSLALMSFPFIL